MQTQSYREVIDIGRRWQYTQVPDDICKQVIKRKNIQRHNNIPYKVIVSTSTCQYPGAGNSFPWYKWYNMIIPTNTCQYAKAGNSCPFELISKYSIKQQYQQAPTSIQLELKVVYFNVNNYLLEDGNIPKHQLVLKSIVNVVHLNMYIYILERDSRHEHFQESKGMQRLSM